jgi:integrase/recombinase XerD
MNERKRTELTMTRADTAVVGFLARYSSAATVTAYAMDLRLLFEWCAAHGLEPLEVTRAHLELFARHLENDRGNGPSTIHRRLSTIKCFYRIAEIDAYVDKSPATHLRLPRVYRDETKTLGLDRVELGAIIAAARESTPSDAALITMLGLLGLRVSEACNVRIQDIHGLERGHRTLVLVGKGRKPATIPLPLSVAQVMDAAAGERASGPLLLRVDGRQMDRNAAARVVVRLAKEVGINKRLSPHSLRHAFVTACLDAGVPLRDVQIAARHSDPRMTTRYDRARGDLDRHANYIVAGFIAGSDPPQGSPGTHELADPPGRNPRQASS